MNKITRSRIIETLFASLAIAVLTLFLLKYYSANILVVIAAGILVLLMIIRCVSYERFNKVFDVFIRFRYLIALLLFIVCLGLRLNNSSMGIYDDIFTTKNDYSVKEIYAGKAQLSRGDEFGVQTPYYFSQYYNGYKEISHQMSISGQDMIIGYNSPVKDLTLIGKPFTWGYILFGNELGLSWYTCMKTILFLLVTFELSMLITSKNKKLSVFSSFLIVFSPAIQWWFSPHMPDVFFWGSSLVVIGYYFFMARKRWLKWLMTILAPCTIIGFIFALFPSCQIPVGMLGLALLIMLIIRDKKDLIFTKHDVFRIVFAVVVIGIVLINFWMNASDQIKLLLNTVYPGSRVSTGGDGRLGDLFFDLTNIVTPYITTNVNNNSEVSTFIQFAPLFIIYFPFIVYSRNKHGKRKSQNFGVGIVLLVALLIEIYFMLIGFPTWLAKITLFSYINRMKIVYGFTAVLFTVWSLGVLIKNRELMNKRYMVICVLLTSILNYLTLQPDNFKLILDYQKEIGMSGIDLSRIFYIVVITAVAVLLLMIFFKKTALGFTILMCLVFISGCTVNPIATGDSAYFNHPISTAIADIRKEDSKANWMVICDDSTIQGFVLANGVRLINAVNFYPDYGKWKLIDRKKKHDFVYNRYAHISFGLVNGNRYYKKLTNDSIYIDLKFSDLKRLKVRYILGRKGLASVLKNNNVKYNTEYIDKDDFEIYHLIY